MKSIFLKSGLLGWICCMWILFSYLTGCGEKQNEAPLAQEVSRDSVGTVAEDEWIVFTSNRSGNGDLYALHLETRELTQVTRSSHKEGGARYDRARNRIIYQRFEEQPGRVVLMSGGEELFVDPNGDTSPAWSPVGDQIVYVSNDDGNDNLKLAQADGRGEQYLSRDRLTDRYPAWSPDGQRIVWARRLESGWDLHIMDVNVNPPVWHRLTEKQTYVGHPSWSPDGRFIAYDTMVEGQTEIEMIEIETGEVTRLTSRPGNDLVPSWSSDQRKMAFAGVDKETGNWDVWMLDLATRTLERMTTHEEFDGGPVFVPSSAIVR